jgi:uncharacterized Zn finger protein
MSRSYYENWYTPSTPKEVKGGIKAQNQRGSFARKWWGKRWIEVLENFRIGARLTRGKSYARKGQVASLNIEKGVVKAKVQGSRSGMYTVEVRLKPFKKKEWDQIINAITENPAFAASLLSGEMPLEMEEHLSSIGLSLFPQKRRDLETWCSCPDSSNPCKHIAAVFYLMAEAFDENPFLLFSLRGMEREDFLEKLQGELPQNLSPEDSSKSEPLPEDPELFWKGAKIEATTEVFSVSPRIHGSLPKRLGNLPFWRGEEPFQKAMEEIYRNASFFGISLLEQKLDEEQEQ